MTSRRSSRLFAWLVRPRRALSWEANHRDYLFWIAVGITMPVFGLTFVIEPQDPSDRWVGVLLLAGTVALGSYVVLHLRRPVGGKPHRRDEGTKWGPVGSAGGARRRDR